MRTLLVGVDGAGGSGKSTVARTLSDKIVPTRENAHVVVDGSGSG